MKELNLHEEIIKSLKLISYDRSLTLNEQSVIGAPSSGYVFTDSDTNPKPLVPKKTQPKKIDAELEKKIQQFYGEQLCTTTDINFCKNYGGTKINYIGDPRETTFQGECACKDGNKKFEMSKWNKSINAPMSYSIVLNKQFDIENSKNIDSRFKDYSSDLLNKMYDPLTVNQVLRMVKEEIKTLSKISWEQKKKLLKDKEFKKRFIQKTKKDLKYYETFRGGEFDPLKNIDMRTPYGLSKDKESQKIKKENKIKNYKQEKLKWENRLCGVAKQVCGEYGGPKAYQDKEGYWKCGCKNNVQIVTDKQFFDSPENVNKKSSFYTHKGSTTVDAYYRIGDYGKVYTETSWNVKEWVTDPSILMAVGSIAATILIPGLGGVIIGGAIDIMDIGYSLSIGDPVSAGIGLVCMVVPLGKLMNIIGRSVNKQMLKRIVEKTARGHKLTKSEREIASKLTKPATLKLGLKIAVRKLMLKIFDKKLYKGKQGLYYMSRAILFLLRTGYVSTSFLTKMILYIGTIGVTVYEVLKLFNLLPKELEKKIKEKTTSDLNLLIPLLFKTLIQNKDVLDIDMKNTKNPVVLMLQYVLKSGGFFETKIPTFDIRNGQITVNKNGDQIKKITRYDITGKLKDSFVNNKFNNIFTLRKSLNEGVSILDVEFLDGRREKIKVLHKVGSQQLNLPLSKTQQKNIPKWWYFDELTKNAVIKYQSKNGLTPNGIVNDQTLKLLVKQVETNIYGDIKNYANINLENLFDAGGVLPETTNNITQEQANNAYLNSQEQIADSVANEADENFNNFPVDYHIETIDTLEFKLFVDGTQ